MMLLRFGSGRELSIRLGIPDALHRGAGLRRLGFPVELDVRNSINAGVPLVLSGQVWLGQHRSDWLGTLTTDKPVVTYAEPFSARLLLALSDDQLAVIEQRRAGADFVFGVDVDVVLGYDPAVFDVADPSDRWPAKSDQYPLHVHRETWVRLLAQVDAGTSRASSYPHHWAPEPTATSDGTSGRPSVRSTTASTTMRSPKHARPST